MKAGVSLPISGIDSPGSFSPVCLLVFLKGGGCLPMSGIDSPHFMRGTNIFYVHTNNVLGSFDSLSMSAIEKFVVFVTIRFENVMTKVLFHITF